MTATHTVVSLAACAALLAAEPASAVAQSDPSAPTRARFSSEEVQGILAVQALDGWLLADKGGQNRIATWLVNPAGKTTRRWFYLIPASGQPTVLVHRAEASAFEQVPGKKIEYTGHRDLKEGLRAMLKGIKKVGMEYAPKSGIPSLSLVDAATVELVRSVRIDIQSSAKLVQFTKGLWGPEGRVAHYIAVHHLDKLREDALAFVRKRIERGETVTEYHVQQRILRGYKVRGISGPPPLVAVNENAADLSYRPTFDKSAQIRRGDLLLLELAASVEGVPRPIFADISWVAYVGDSIPDRYKATFEALAKARNTAYDYVKSRIDRRRPVQGFQVDQKARQVIGAAGHGDKFIHRTGHSLDTSLDGDGADLDDYETHDTRLLVKGAGFTIEPGVYYKGDFGMRTGINVYVGLQGVEVTTPVQTEVTAILGN